MKSIFLFSFLAVLIVGCSKQGGGLILAGANGSGDLVPLVMQCATNRGAYPATNTLPAILADWTHQSRDIQDIILVSGDHFTEVQKVLEQLYGAPNPTLGSSAVAPVGIGKALTYSPKQCGVVLNLTGYQAQTIVSVMGRKK